MTAPIIFPTAIEHAQPELTCGHERHGRTPPKADWWIDQHGCLEDFLCDPCLTYIEKVFNERLEIPPVVGWVPCDHCGDWFDTFAEMCPKRAAL